ncbi:hypothetical protein [Actinoalloteichus spitiensis]|uniref:hypothetical protein n=1 Tax=Actinoalloteichus spitiensis TaxID=252394 RepID=UPI0012F6D6DA|nr:hypothetical protein [Actinoalloteichus spitiensis]
MTHEDAPPGPSWSGALPGLGGMVLLGGTVAVTGATHHLPTFAVQSARYAVAALGVVVVARCLRVRLVPPRGSELVWVVAGALSGLVLFTLAVVLGTRHTEPGVFGAAVACVPVVLAVAGPLARGGRPSARLVTGAVVVSAGAVAVAGWSRADIPGVLLAASLPACEAAFTLFGAQRRRALGRLELLGGDLRRRRRRLPGARGRRRASRPGRVRRPRRPARGGGTPACWARPPPSCSGSPASDGPVPASPGSRRESPGRAPRCAGSPSGRRHPRRGRGWAWG